MAVGGSVLSSEVACLRVPVSNRRRTGHNSGIEVLRSFEVLPEVPTLQSLLLCSSINAAKNSLMMQRTLPRGAKLPAECRDGSSVWKQGWGRRLASWTRVSGHS